MAVFVPGIVLGRHAHGHGAGDLAFLGDGLGYGEFHGAGSGDGFRDGYSGEGTPLYLGDNWLAPLFSEPAHGL